MREGAPGSGDGRKAPWEKMGRSQRERRGKKVQLEAKDLNEHNRDQPAWALGNPEKVHEFRA